MCILDQVQVAEARYLEPLDVRLNALRFLPDEFLHYKAKSDQPGDTIDWGIFHHEAGYFLDEFYFLLV